MRKLLLLFLISVILPAYAGIYEDALSSGNDVLLYLYTSYCKTCHVMEPYFDEIVQSHDGLTGVKVNAESPYGMSLMRKYSGRYVPYVVLSSPKSGRSVSVDSSCFIDRICMERVIKGIN